MKETEENTKTIGVLGGYGPYATQYFFRLLLEQTPAEKDWEHCHIIIENNPRIPSRTRAFLYNEESPLPYMQESIERLKKAGADFFACPCNSAHYFLREKRSATVNSLPFLDMVDVVVDEIKKDKIKCVGLIAAEVPVLGKLYEDPLKKEGIELVNISELEKTRFVIEAGKQNKNKEDARIALKELIRELKEKGAEAIIYGCTELPMVLPPEEVPEKVYDTSLILAQKSVKLAKEGR